MNVVAARRPRSVVKSACLSSAALFVLGACSRVGGGSSLSTSTALSGTASGDAGAVADGSVAAIPLRDWDAFPAIVQVARAREIWAISDIHADYAALTKLLAAANIIDSVPASPWDVQWTAGRATFVVVGDSIDRGPDGVDVLRLLMALQRSAEHSGGRLIVTMGNHEAEFLANPANIAAADGAVGIDHELAADGISVDATVEGEDSIGRFLRDLPIAARVENWFFVHAGNTHGQTIAEMTSAIQTGLDSSGFGAPVLSLSTSFLEQKFSTTSTVQWWDATGDATSLLTTWTTALGVQHLVMGHQPQPVAISGGTARLKDQMAAEYGGLLFFIDTGMSVDVDDTGGALLHIQHAGSKAESWSEVLPDGSVQSL